MSKFDHWRNFVIVTPSAVQAQICLMKPGKAPGYDGMQTEHLPYATLLLMQYLSLLFQACISQQYNPAVLSEGFVTCAFKTGQKLKGVLIVKTNNYLLHNWKAFWNVDLPRNKHKVQSRGQPIWISQRLVCEKRTHNFLAILDRYRMLKKYLYVCATDIWQAFDSIIHITAIFSIEKWNKSFSLPSVMELVW